VLLVVQGHDLVEELGRGNVIVGKVLGDGDTVFAALEELGYSNVVGGEKFSDGGIEELGHRDVVLLEELS